jgi:hypothetical protein
MREHETEVRWASWTGDTTERLLLGFENDGWTAEGQIAGLDIHYVIRFDRSWQVRYFMLFRDDDEPDLWLARDGSGTWGEVNGATRDDLSECTDIHVIGSPFSLGLPARRLGLTAGESATVTVAQVDPETLGVVAVTRSWRRLEGDELGLEHPETGHWTVVAIDEIGVVIDEPGRFKRLPPAGGPDADVPAAGSAAAAELPDQP